MKSALWLAFYEGLSKCLTQSAFNPGSLLNPETLQITIGISAQHFDLYAWTGQLHTRACGLSSSG